MVAMQHKSSELSGGPPAFSTVAVAVNGYVGEANGGAGSRRAVRWAVENLLPTADRFVLVHVMPTVTSIPSPSGVRIPVDGLDESVVAMYKRDLIKEFEQVFLPFKRICKSTQMETLLLEHNDPSKALLKHISDSGFQCLVMGSSSSNFLARKKGKGIPLTILGEAPEKCEIYVVYKDRILTKSALHFSSIETISSSCTSEAFSFYSSSRASSGRNFFGKLGLSHHSTAIEMIDEHNHPILRHGTTDHADRNKQLKPESIRRTPKLDVRAEVECLRKEVRATLTMYKQACEELVHKQTQVQWLSSECIEEARRVIAALEKEKLLRKAAAEEKEKHLKAAKEVEEAKVLLAKEFCERQLAELNALRQCIEKQKVIDQLFLSDKRYRKYTKDEITTATNNFSPRQVIGEGGYGKVYKCNLDHTPVAVKILKPDSIEKKEEFLREVTVLSQLRHPHVVLLLGACPDNGCLIYEYLDNGSLQDYVSHKKDKPPLPWFIRFRIIYQVACGLAFLHNSKPEPIVHRDLKPGNILLDKNYVSKIGDVGLAKIISDTTPDSITVYKNSVLAGTLYYMDPEYQRTGTIRPKSDLYAFGIIILQLLTSRHPNGLLFCTEDAVKRGCFHDMLDESIKGWPLAEVDELTAIALKCSKLKCRDRPDLDGEILPALKRILESAKSKIKNKEDNIYPPSHYFCPILKEIMEDPYIAADGFTYEYRAIKSWIDKHGVSPVTKQQLKHLDLTPNHTLRSAIHEWRDLPDKLVNIK